MKQILRIILLLTAVLVLAACSSSRTATEPTEQETETVETLPPEQPTEEVLPTQQPTEEAPEADEQEAVPPAELPEVQHSGLREDGSFDEGTWFIGDSMTCILVNDYLTPNNLIGDANYTGKYGAQITAFFDDTVMSYNSYNRCVFRPEHELMGYDDVAEALGEKATAIYMMWGTNYTWNAYAEGYIQLTDYLLETCPNATVHLQLIPWGVEGLVRYDTVNEWVKEAYAHYQEIGEERVFLIDTYTAIGKNTDSGCIHLDYQGNENWYNAIVAHAEENGLVQ